MAIHARPYAGDLIRVAGTRHPVVVISATEPRPYRETIFELCFGDLTYLEREDGINRTSLRGVVVKALLLARLSPGGRKNSFLPLKGMIIFTTDDLKAGPLSRKVRYLGDFRMLCAPVAIIPIGP